MGGAGYGNHGEAAEPASNPDAGGEAGRGGAGADLPPAGPHADPSLVNPDLTPGAGTLPDHNGDDGDVDTTDA